MDDLFAPVRPAKSAMPPSWWLNEVLAGNIAMDDAPKAIQSWARFAIYEGAVEIIKMPDMEKRREALKHIPARIRSLVEVEVKRVWPMRDLIDAG